MKRPTIKIKKKGTTVMSEEQKERCKDLYAKYSKVLEEDIKELCDSCKFTFAFAIIPLIMNGCGRSVAEAIGMLEVIKQIMITTSDDVKEKQVTDITDNLN